MHAIKYHEGFTGVYFVQQYQGVYSPVNPTRFDSMANNGYDINAPPLLSTLLLLSSLSFTVHCYTTVHLYATIPFYGKCFYSTFYCRYIYRSFARSMLMMEALGLTVQRLVVQPEPPAPPPFIDGYKITNGY